MTNSNTAFHWIVFKQIYITMKIKFWQHTTHFTEENSINEHKIGKRIEYPEIELPIGVLKQCSLLTEIMLLQHVKYWHPQTQKGLRHMHDLKAISREITKKQNTL